MNVFCPSIDLTFIEWVLQFRKTRKVRSKGLPLDSPDIWLWRLSGIGKYQDPLVGHSTSMGWVKIGKNGLEFNGLELKMGYEWGKNQWVQGRESVCCGVMPNS